MMDKEKDVYTPDDENKGKRKQLNVVIVLGVGIIICAIVLTAILIGALVNVEEQSESTTRYELTSSDYHTEITTDENYLSEILSSYEETPITQSQTSYSADSDNDMATETTRNALVESYEHMSVNGENKLSDHYENEFIRLIESTYGVDSDLLVAIYSVPDSGTNFVLQFNGKKNKDGELVKSPDTLEKVYQIDLDRNIKVATGTNTGNIGVSYPESVVCFNMIKKIVMPQYPNYFTGVNK